MEKFSRYLTQNGGSLITSGTVTVNYSGTSTPAVIYSDSGITLLSQPFNVDPVTGEIAFYAPNGLYDIAINTPSGNPVAITNVGFFDPTSSIAISGYVNATVGFKVNGAALAYSHLSGTVPTASLPVFTGGAAGIVPVSGGGTSNFLRADGTFASPSVWGNITGTLSSQTDLATALADKASLISPTFTGMSVFASVKLSQLIAGGDPYADVRWYGAVGDGITDDYAAIQACLDANKGKRILLPKMRPAVFGGGGGGLIDYYCSQRLVMSGNGTQLVGGGGPAKWSGAVAVKFPSGVGGIRIAYDCVCAYIGNLELHGGDQFAQGSGGLYWPDWNSIASLSTVDDADGIQVQAGEWTIENVCCEGFGRHGFFIDGWDFSGHTGQPDIGKGMSLMANNNRAWGIFIHGVDGQVATYMNCNLIGNCLGGVYDNAWYGNTHIAHHTSLNARDATPAGVSVNVTSITVNSVTGIATIITAAPHNWSAGMWATSTGSLDATFNETAKLLTATGSTATYKTIHATGSTTGGTAATSASTAIIAYYKAHGLLFAPYASRNGSIWISPYVEMNQSYPDYGPYAMTLNAQGFQDYSSGAHLGVLPNSSMFVMRGNGLCLIPISPTNSWFQGLNVGGTVNNWCINMNSGDYKSIGKMRLGQNPIAPYDGINGALELPNGDTTGGIYFRNQAGTAYTIGIYRHTDNGLYLSDAATTTTINGPLRVVKALTLQDPTTTTKAATFDLSGITAGQTRIVTIANAASTTVVPDTGAANNFITAISATGVISKAQPTFANLSGSATAAQLPVFGAAAAGIVPLSGGGTANFLRADGTWTTPPVPGATAWGTITGTLSSQTDLNTALGLKANSASLATVATSGSYNDLSNKPTSIGAVIATVTGTNSVELVRGNMADNDQARILVGGTATNAGFLEIATADDGTEPIYVRQYTGTFVSLVRTATLLDGSGNSSFPGTISGAAYQVSGTALAASHLSNGTTGSGAVVLANNPIFVTNDVTLGGTGKGIVFTDATNGHTYRLYTDGGNLKLVQVT